MQVLVLPNHWTGSACVWVRVTHFRSLCTTCYATPETSLRKCMGCMPNCHLEATDGCVEVVRFSDFFNQQLSSKNLFALVSGRTRGEANGSVRRSTEHRERTERVFASRVSDNSAITKPVVCARIVVEMGSCSITQLLSRPKVFKSHCVISQEPLLNRGEKEPCRHCNVSSRSTKLDGALLDLVP